MSEQKSALVGMLGVSLLWGCNYVASAWLLGHFSPIFLSFARISATSIFFVIVALRMRGLRWPSRREWVLLGCVGVFGTLLNQVFYFTGLVHSNPGTASLIIGLAPVATVLLERIVLKVRFTGSKLSGIALGVAGVSVIVAVGGGGGHGSLAGDLNLLIAMLALAVSVIFVRKLSVTLSPYAITIFSTVLGTLLMAPAAGGEALLHQSHVSHSLAVWGILAAAGVIAQGLAAFWWNRGVAILGAGTAAMFMNLPPFIAIIAAHFVLHEPILLAQVGGGALILGGVFVANQASLRGSARPPLVTTAAPAEAGD